MTGIQFTNLGEVLAGMEKRQQRLNDIPKLAKQMGVLALNEIRPLCHVLSGTWQGSWQAPKVEEIGSFKYLLTVYSSGAFTDAGYNYGARQERLFHPGDIGWHKANPAMIDLWNSKMKGMITANAAGMSDFFNLDVGSW